MGAERAKEWWMGGGRSRAGGGEETIEVRRRAEARSLHYPSHGYCVVVLAPGLPELLLARWKRRARWAIS